MSTSAIIQQVAAARPLANEDEQFWWQATGPYFATLLENSGYTPEQLEYNLSWYRRFIPRSLGPSPTGKKYCFTAGPVRDGSPVEPSLNWRGKSKSSRLVRFAIGVSNSNAGTDADPFGQEETGRLLRSMSNVIPDLCMKKYDKFAQNLFIKKENQAALLEIMSEDTPRAQSWLAFDVKSSGPMAKAYFLPYLKMIETDKHTNDFISQIYRQCGDEFGSYSEGADTINRYIETFDSTPELAPRAIIFGIDCFGGPGSRIKTYLSTSAKTLNEVKDLYTLGGRISGPNADGGVEALVEFWPIFFNLKTGEDFGEKDVFPAGSGAIACVELKPGQAIPEVKIHIPISMSQSFDIKDGELSDRLAAWFRTRGDGNFADKYRSDLEKTL